MIQTTMKNSSEALNPRSRINSRVEKESERGLYVFSRSNCWTCGFDN